MGTDPKVTWGFLIGCVLCSLVGMILPTVPVKITLNAIELVAFSGAVVGSFRPRLNQIAVVAYREIGGISAPNACQRLQSSAILSSNVVNQCPVWHVNWRRPLSQCLS